MAHITTWPLIIFSDFSTLFCGHLYAHVSHSH